MFNSKGTISVDLSKKVDSVLNAFKTTQAEKEALETICKKNESVLAKLTAILE